MANITVKRLPKTMDYYYIKILLNHHVNNLSTCDDKRSGSGAATESAIQESSLTKLGGFGVQGSGVARQDSIHKDCIDKVLKKRHDSCNKKRLFLGTFRLLSPPSVSCSQPVVNL